MTSVRNLDYVVERHGSRWTVAFQTARCGEFRSRREALEAALRDAERVRRLGHHVRVLVRRPDNHLRALPESLHL